ncbi:MAG: Trypsin-like peptidase domain [Candidatus Sulfotelmatobacter sp.]|nr:Trypsin-like peptidase domain [Candidatus Sulfotelmatobacter sp.]
MKKQEKFELFLGKHKGKSGKRREQLAVWFGLFFVFLVSFFSHVLVQHARDRAFAGQAENATGAIYLNGHAICSGASFAPGYFLTARHCVVDEQYDLRGDEYISFSANEKGPFYQTQIVALSLTDDIAILRIVNGSNVPWVGLGDESRTPAGHPILNFTYALDQGKMRIEGRFIEPIYAHLPGVIPDSYPEWNYSMPVDMTIASGSSGSPIFDAFQQEIIGVVVGDFRRGGFGIVIPVSRVWHLLNHLSENSVQEFQKKFPHKEVEPYEL